jgi:hypothetical protein
MQIAALLFVQYPHGRRNEHQHRKGGWQCNHIWHGHYYVDILIIDRQGFLQRLQRWRIDAHAQELDAAAAEYPTVAKLAKQAIENHGVIRQSDYDEAMEEAKRMEHRQTMEDLREKVGAPRAEYGDTTSQISRAGWQRSRYYAED